MRKHEAQISPIMLVCGLVIIAVSAASAQEIRTAAELGLAGLDPTTEVLVVENDPTLAPVQPIQTGAYELPLTTGGWGDASPFTGSVRTGLRAGCGDEGFSTLAYARDTYSNYLWVALESNTQYGDDLTLAPGEWIIQCYDTLIFASNPAGPCSLNRTVTVSAYDGCPSATPIPGSTVSYNVPPHGGPVLLTGVYDIEFPASGTIWFGITTTSNMCDAWYLGATQVVGSTSAYVRYMDDCETCVDDCTQPGFLAIMYGCTLPEITAQPQPAAICDGDWHQFCVSASGAGPFEYQWQLDGQDIPAAESPCYVATAAGTYRCVVTSDCGPTVSDEAVLAVRTGPEITADPAGGVICTAVTHELCVEADGVGDVYYQWKRNGLSMLGATGECHDATQSGAYTCVVTDDCGASTSAAADVVATTPETGDLDGDGTCGLSDFVILQSCLVGPTAAPPVECPCTDISGDGSLDLADFAALQLLFTP